MTETPATLIDITKAIQLSLAPAFLLAGIGGLLNVMTGRLARIIDRGRMLTESPQYVALCEEGQLQPELQGLERRRFYISVAVTSCTVAALLLCLVIATLFMEVMFSVPFKWVIGTLFAFSTIALVVSLAFFLREVHIAMRTIHIPTFDPKNKQTV